MSEKVGPYEIEAVLHKTANSKVYVVSYKGEKAVLKIPAKWDLGKEVALLQSIQHPNIVPVLKVERKLGGYVMPFISNRSVEDYCNGGAVPWKQFQKMARAIISALAALHQKGIIYSDLSPNNILLDDDQPILIDFGLAHRTSDILPIQGRGTSGFIPPEVLEGRKWSFSGDVYSLGLLLKKMMEPYWEKETPQAEKWRAVIELCLLENPEERPKTSSDVERLLVQIAEQEKTPKEEKKDSPVVEVEKYPRWVYIAGIVCVLVGILGGVYLSLK